MLNHGRGGYSTAEHLVQTAFYERSFGITPRCSLYYVGWNDVRGSHMPGSIRAMRTSICARRSTASRARRADGGAVLLARSARRRLLVLGVDTARPAGDVEGMISGAPDAELEAIYARNIDTISAINRQRGIRTVWSGR